MGESSVGHLSEVLLGVSIAVCHLATLSHAALSGLPKDFHHGSAARGYLFLLRGLSRPRRDGAATAPGGRLFPLSVPAAGFQESLPFTRSSFRDLASPFFYDGPGFRYRPGALLQYGF